VLVSTTKAVAEAGGGVTTMYMRAATAAIPAMMARPAPGRRTESMVGMFMANSLCLYCLLIHEQEIVNEAHIL
jgi:hypothetical protein